VDQDRPEFSGQIKRGRPLKFERAVNTTKTPKMPGGKEPQGIQKLHQGKRLPEGKRRNREWGETNHPE